MTVQSLKTGILVTVVTLLIWVYAESESLRTAEVTATATFSSPPASGRAVWLEDSGARAVELKVRIEGAAAAIDALRNQLRAAPIALEPDRGLPTEPGEHSIDLRAALRTTPPFASAGVTIAEVSPSTALVRVDELATYEAPVRVELPPGTETVGPPEAQPTPVRITAPESLLDATPGLRDQPATARLDPSYLATLTPGRLERIGGVPLQVPQALRDQPYVSIEPRAATITLTLRDQTDSYTLPTVPVQIRIPPIAYAEWDIRIPQDSQFLRNVRVTGPRDLVAQVRDGRLPIIAYVPLTPEDLTRGITSKDAVFSDLPGSPLRFEAEDRAVRLEIARRMPGAGPPDGQ